MTTFKIKKKINKFFFLPVVNQDSNSDDKSASSNNVGNKLDTEADELIANVVV